MPSFIPNRHPEFKKRHLEKHFKKGRKRYDLGANKIIPHALKNAGFSIGWEIIFYKGNICYPYKSFY